MNYKLIKEFVDLLQEYDQQTTDYQADMLVFSKWLHQKMLIESAMTEPEWDGKSNGRSADSVINTLLVHLSRYAKLHAKNAIQDSIFSTSDEFIYLISLKSYGAMNKTALIKMNVHEKSAGIQIINRLLIMELVEQIPDLQDKRNKIIHLTEKGRQELEGIMGKIRHASSLVTGNMTHSEKMELIRLLSKLELHHKSEFNGIF
ncbi:winged helix-turn-helix transcriptional regulator [Sphingobacteriaceae bacterium WQ 2009]|uniref:Winged helix-turn-helix transcriptional regulator n=1 Tax=Rhinopithecimicrobium faecis TaxID=2820698 RepID=A0A8T4HFY0_9SPHI|nr:winged helix-turn-helix transcriptional regulator [Sphingobacteriaceae bacterium WQ 2009]